MYPGQRSFDAQLRAFVQACFHFAIYAPGIILQFAVNGKIGFRYFHP
jgi:hypothetical protein